MTDFITLIDEDGKEHQFEIEAILDVEEEKYAVLIPMDEEYANTNEAVIMKFGLDETGEEVLYDIDNEEEWDKVADVYDELIEEADDFIEEDEDFDEEDEDDDEEEDNIPLQ